MWQINLLMLLMLFFSNTQEPIYEPTASTIKKACTSSAVTAASEMCLKYVKVT